MFLKEIRYEDAGGLNHEVQARGQRQAYMKAVINLVFAQIVENIFTS
jgi:hypothetical protein